MTTFIFNGKRIDQPGVFAQVQSGINNPPLELLSGNVLLIDKNPLSIHGNGSGIIGDQDSGNNSIYEFDSLSSFRRWIGGGVPYELAQPLFRPFGNAPGASRLFYTRALTTTGATVSLAFDAGTIELRTLNEGLSGNGVIVNGRLTRGYSVLLEAGTLDPAKVILRFYRGAFKGNDPISGQAYDDISEGDTNPEIISQSPEISTLEELIEWTKEDSTFINNFKIVSEGDTSGGIIAADLAGFANDQLFAGGTSVYATERITEILEAIENVNINFILTEDTGVNAISIDNVKIATFLDTEMPDPATLIVAAGNTSGHFNTQSVPTARFFNSQNAIIIHGGINITNLRSPTGVREKGVLYKAAQVAGRLAGLDPQTPLTYKGIDIAGELHDLTSSEISVALNAGVLTTAYSSELQFYRVVQGINSIQNNNFVVNSDGTSHSISVVRIAKQLLRELKINAVIDLLGDQENGPNRATLDEETVRTWVANYLKSRQASFTEDDLIIDYRDITVTTNQDAYEVAFGFQPNFEVNKIFITARILDDSTIN